MSGDRMSQLALTNNNNKSRLIFGIMKIDVIIWIHDLGKNCNSYCYLRILAIDERCRIFLTAYLTEIMNFLTVVFVAFNVDK